MKKSELLPLNSNWPRTWSWFISWTVTNCVSRVTELLEKKNKENLNFGEQRTMEKIILAEARRSVVALFLPECTKAV